MKYKCQEWDSNPRRSAYESDALPTELSWPENTIPCLSSPEIEFPLVGSIPTAATKIPGTKEVPEIFLCFFNRALPALHFIISRKVNFPLINAPDPPLRKTLCLAGVWNTVLT